MDTTNQLITYHSNEWMSILLGLLFLVALYFLQKYLYLLDEKLLVNEDSKTVGKQKPWPLWIAILLGFSVFLYDVFSPNDLILFRGDWPVFQWMMLILSVVTIVGLFGQSLLLFGIQKGLIRGFIYLILMAVFFFAGFISGLLVIGLFILFVLLFFIKYFKNQLTIK
jgi:hypothetical protein